MNTQLFSEAITEIDSQYYEEAARYIYKSKKYGWIKWGAMAACFIMVLAAAYLLLPDTFLKPNILPPDHSNSIIAEPPEAEELPETKTPPGTKTPSETKTSQETKTPPAASEIHISMSNIYVNEITGFLEAARKYYDPTLYEDVVWDKEDIRNYYGKKLTAPYIPDGLTAAPGNGTAAVIAGREGEIAEDTVWLNFYHDYYEDGSPKLTEEVAAPKGFSVTASKLGLLNDCIYILPENDVKTSDIGKTAVTFGHRSMPYGPYDPVTHAPSGYYDMYVVDFKHEGIEYQIVAEQMEADEVVKVAASVILGKEVIIDK